MKLLAVHPGPLMYTQIYLRLEPLGLEFVAEAARRAGHQVQLIDLQVETHKAYFKRIERWQPEVVTFSCNYLANVPEIIDLAKQTKEKLPHSFILVGGHSASFVPRDILEHGAGAINCVLKGEGEASIALLLQAIEHDPQSVTKAPGAVTVDGEGPPPRFVESLDDLRPARDLLRHRRKYFIGVLDPCASIEFSRGCPWDCVFCSAWTFYGRSYRVVSPDKAAADLMRIKEPNVFIVDDVAFIQSHHGFAIGEAIMKKGTRKKYYLETRGDVLLRNKEVFQFWKTLGLTYMFLGIEAIDEDGLRRHRKRVSLGTNFEALEVARSLGLTVAVNIIADPDWDEERFNVVRKWCLDIPEIVNISVNTPYPGTETWHTEARRVQTRDYRLYDIQHAVLPTKLPLPRFYEELVKTQQVLNQKHLGWTALKSTAKIAAGHLLRGQTNFVKMLWKFNRVYNPQLQLADPSTASAIRHDPAAASTRHHQARVALYSCSRWAPRSRHRCRGRAVCGRNPNGNKCLAFLYQPRHARVCGCMCGGRSPMLWESVSPKNAGKPRRSRRGWIGVGRAGLNAQAANIFLCHSGALNGRWSGEDGNPGIHAGEDVHQGHLLGFEELRTSCARPLFRVFGNDPTD